MSVSVSERAAQSFFFSSSSYDWFMCNAVGFHSTFPPKYHFTSKGSSSPFPSAEMEKRRTLRERKKNIFTSKSLFGIK